MTRELLGRVLKASQELFGQNAGQVSSTLPQSPSCPTWGGETASAVAESSCYLHQ
eukprot:COSAG02_NODE_290_length_25531_cov_75.132392_7_plen_55_part_00